MRWSEASTCWMRQRCTRFHRALKLRVEPKNTSARGSKRLGFEIAMCWPLRQQDRIRSFTICVADLDSQKSNSLRRSTALCADYRPTALISISYIGQTATPTFLVSADTSTENNPKPRLKKRFEHWRTSFSQEKCEPSVSRMKRRGEP